MELQESKDPKERPETRAFQESTVQEDLPESLDLREAWVSQATRDKRETKAHVDQLDEQAVLERLETLVLLERRELKV